MDDGSGSLSAGRQARSLRPPLMAAIDSDISRPPPMRDVCVGCVGGLVMETGGRTASTRPGQHGVDPVRPEIAALTDTHAASDRSAEPLMKSRLMLTRAHSGPWCGMYGTAQFCAAEPFHLATGQPRGQDSLRSRTMCPGGFLIGDSTVQVQPGAR